MTSTAGQAATVSAKAAAASATAPSCLIRVSFEGAFPGSTALAATATVNVVFMQTLVLRPQGYDVTGAQGTLAVVADAAAAFTVLQPVACSTSDYEQVGFSDAQQTPMLCYCCTTAEQLLCYCCTTAELLLCYCCATAVLLLCYCLACAKACHRALGIAAP